MGIMRTLLLWSSENQWMRQRVPGFRFVREAVRRFMPGERATDVITTAKQFQELGIPTIFTYLGENITHLSEAAQVTNHYLAVLEQIAAEKLPAEISLKLTQLGFDLEEEKTYQNFKSIALKAQAHQIVVWIDMEGSAYTGRTIEFYRRARAELPNTGLCLQAYLYRTHKDVEELLPLSPTIRLVKGAYNEAAEIAFEKKNRVDRNYLELAKRLLKGLVENGARVVFGTHDLKIISEIEKFAESQGISREKLEFHMLYGIKSNEQRRLSGARYRVGVLISYGDAWFPWYMRRLAERPANLTFVLKNLFTR
jgi:proline dehydrogenase